MSDLQLLCLAAVTIGVGHTLLGPDHYLPFVAMSRVGNWSLRKTTWVTVLCGIGHVLGSVILGVVGIAFGVAVLKLEPIEEIRGDLAGWLLLTFGLIYLVWGLNRALRNRPHVHMHADGTVHSHGPDAEHSHDTAAASASPRRPLTPWVLFTIFLFGPCEPLIPMLMYPAARGSAWSVALVSGLFGLATLTTMLAMVWVMYLGADLVRLGRLERYGHALAGLVVFACGLAIKLGL